MEVVERLVDELLADPANVRRHDERNLDAIKASLARFGQQKPIVLDANGVVRAGNGTLAAAKALGWQTIQATVSGLEGAELTAYAIADNRTAELASWDDGGLSRQLQALADQDEELAAAAGFTRDELEELLEQFDVDVVEPPTLSDETETPAYQQVTFTLHRTQLEAVRDAVTAAKNDGHGASEINDNSNGNAISAICRAYLETQAAEHPDA